MLGARRHGLVDATRCRVHVSGWLAASRDAVGRAGPARQLADHASVRDAVAARSEVRRPARAHRRGMAGGSGRASSAATSATRGDQDQQDGHGPLGRDDDTHGSRSPHVADLVSGERPATGAHGARPGARSAVSQRRYAAGVRLGERLRRVGPLHHARPAGVDAAVQLQQRRSHPSGAGLRRHRPRDDPRGAGRADRAAAARSRDQAVARRVARPLGRRDARRRDRQLHRQGAHADCRHSRRRARARCRPRRA